MRRIVAMTGLAAILAGCDQATQAELAAVRAELEDSRAAFRALRGEHDRLTVELEREREARRACDAAREVPPPPVTATPDPPAPPIEVACEGGACTITRTQLAALVDGGGGALAKAARIVPWIDGGKTVGFKLFGIRPGSMFASIGLLNGDALTELNGVKLDGIEALARSFADVQKLDKIVIRGDRKGAPLEVTVAVK